MTLMRSGDEGRLSVFFAGIFMAVVIIAGATFDGVRQILAAQRAEFFAAEAARAGGQRIRGAQAITGGLKEVEVGVACAAVDAYIQNLRNQGHQVRRANCFSPDNSTLLTVDVLVTVRFAMLSFMLGESREQAGSATVQLVTDSNR